VRELLEKGADANVIESDLSVRYCWYTGLPSHVEVLQTDAFCRPV